MRIHEDYYGYKIELRRDPLTQLAISWRYIIYRIRPI